MPPIEVLLPLGAVAFYLFDSSMMLCGDELALEWRARRWLVSGGLDALLGGRRLFLPNPFTPHALLFQVRWGEDTTTPAPDAYPRLEQLDRALAPVKIPVVALAVILFGVLPPVSWYFGAGAALLAVFGAAYLLVGAALVLLYRRRKALSLTPRRYAGLAFEALACAPFAINLVRKVSLAQSQWLQVESLAAAHFDAASRRRIAALVDARIGERLALEGADSARAAKLEALRDRMRRMARDPD